MSIQNHLLKNLLPQDFVLLSKHFEAVELPFRFSLESSHRLIPYVYFPEDGIVSVIATGEREQTIEVGIIGRDGMTGYSILLGADRSPNAMYMQIAGHGMRISRQHFLAAIRESETLLSALLVFVQAFLIQASHTALANGRAKLEVRIARWLIMAHDRLQDARLPLTHEILSLMLGVRRPGVTVALHKLEANGFIETQRNGILVKNRYGLEGLADGVYGVPETEQERLTGWQPLHRK